MKTVEAFMGGLVVGGIAAAAAVAFALDKNLLADLTKSIDGLADNLESKRTKVAKGDLVQWESNGTFVFPTPRKIVKIEYSEFGTYVFVENSKTGIPINEVFKV